MCSEFSIVHWEEITAQSSFHQREATDKRLGHCFQIYTVVFILVSDDSCIHVTFNNTCTSVITQCIYNMRCIKLQHNFRLAAQLAMAVCKFNKRYLKVGLPKVNLIILCSLTVTFRHIIYIIFLQRETPKMSESVSMVPERKLLI